MFSVKINSTFRLTNSKISYINSNINIIEYIYILYANRQYLFIIQLQYLTHTLQLHRYTVSQSYNIDTYCIRFRIHF